MNEDRIQVIITAVKSIGGAVIGLGCILWLWLAPTTAPEQTSIMEGFNVLVKELGAVLLAILSLYNAGMALKDLLFAKHQAATLMLQIRLQELILKTEDAKLGIPSSNEQE